MAVGEFTQTARFGHPHAGTDGHSTGRSSLIIGRMPWLWAHFQPRPEAWMRFINSQRTSPTAPCGTYEKPGRSRVSSCG
ncbi:protein of unknown function (plasmid) [Pararobbsia alpina]